MQKETYIWGAGHYGVLAALNCEQKGIKVAGFIDVNAGQIKTRLGLLVLAPDEIYKKQEDKQVLIAIQNENAIKEIATNLKSHGINFEISNMVLNSSTPNNYYTISETHLLALGAMLSKQQSLINSCNINDYEFKIFSQFGDDGIIQYLTKNLNIYSKTFIEFGVEDYLESNTRFLMMNDNWEGFVIDGSEKYMERLKTQTWFWKYNLHCRAAFIDKDNINDLLRESSFENIGILSIDLDGNDYHIFAAIDLSKLNPSIIIMEYNAVFGKEKALTIPYDKAFDRTKAHYSNLYFGASLPALNMEAEKKGYSFIGCNSNGNNAYFVRNDLLNVKIKKLSICDGFKNSKFRESRDESGKLTFISGEERFKLIRDLPIIDLCPLLV